MIYTSGSSSSKLDHEFLGYLGIYSLHDFQPPQISDTNSAEPGMAFSRISHSDRGELRVYDSLDDLTANLAEYVAELSEASVKDHGVFSIALSGGSLISLMGYCS